MKHAEWMLAVALLAGGCGKDSASPAATTATTSGSGCPAGSTLTGTMCKAGGRSRIATITWAGAVGDQGPTLNVKNTAGATLKQATVALWFYDVHGARLDVAGSKKWMSPSDAITSLAPGAAANSSFGFLKANIPTNTAEIEGEVIVATLANPDGSDGPQWKNDDLAADDRAMQGTPPPGAAVAANNAAGAAPPPPGAPPSTPGGAVPRSTTTATPHATGTAPARGASAPAHAAATSRTPGAPGHH